MVSMSVTCTHPPVEPRPMSAQFLSISQPMAPAPTRKYLSEARRSWKLLPKTAICPSYRVPSSLYSSADSSASGRASISSSTSHWRKGVNLPLHALSASCATKPPRIAAMGDRSPRALLARVRSSFSSTSSTSLAALLSSRAISTTSRPWSALPGYGSWLCLAWYRSRAWKPSSSWGCRSILPKSLGTNSGSAKDSRRDL
mmetsp:Transcript_58183/g.152981  ORF Transcript_58183/g.152981 Transcript_58183/m.152981 type:complete len:200 (+) Transcript_58183:2130-2729(+)